ncbi:MAG: ATP-binding cassette domain-containing protein [Bacilli bacterium]|nr:ATP-binding cassette domain-containing protein [Bacilli bacterium]
MSFDEFEKVWNHIILDFYPKVPIIYIEPNHVLKNNFLELLKKEKSPFLIILFLSIIITIFSIFYSSIVEHFISLLNTHNEYGYLYFSILFYLLLILIKNGSSFIRNKLFFHIYERIDFKFMKMIFHEILHLPYRYYKNRTTGEMIARIEDIGVIRSFLATVILSSIMDFPLIFMSSICLYFLSEKLFMITLISLLIYVFFYFFYQRNISKKVEQLEEEGASVTSYMVESIGGYESLFGSHLKEMVEKRFSDRYLSYIGSSKKLEMLQNKLESFNSLLYDFTLLSILAFGIYLISKEEMSISSLLLFHSLFIYFIEPVRSILRVGREWEKVKVSWKRLSNLFHEQKEIGIYDDEMKGKIEFKNVAFSYSYHNPTLKKLSFNIRTGSKVLLVGESGNGKSTILKLLMKYYEVERDSIYIDGIDINDYKMEAIDKNIIYVSMKEQLFTGTIYQNILCGKKADSHYKDILKLTEVEEIIRKSPLGHHLILEENGANLSGGEKQRVILARTLLLPFNILLLDESTSQLDSDMERRILKRLFEKYPNKTIIMVAHRENNADLFDQMIEIKDGKIKKDVKKNE